MRSTFTTALLCLLALFATGRNALAQADTVNVALFDLWPYARYDSQGQAKGIYVDLVHAIAAHAGLQARIELYPFARVAATVDSGRADMTLSFTTPALERAALQLGQVVMVDAVVVLKKGLTHTDARALSGQLVGRLPGGCADLTGSAAVLREVQHLDSGVRMLEAGRLDGLCASRETFLTAIDAAQLPRAAFGPEIVLSRRAVQLHVSRRSDEALRNRLQQSLLRLQSERRLEAIWNSRLPVAVPSR